MAAAQPAGDSAIPENNGVAAQLPHWIPSVFKYPRNPLWVLLLAPLITLPGAYALAKGVTILLPGLALPEFKPLVWWLQLINVTVFSPVVETLLMAGLLSLFRRFFGVPQSIVLSAFVWGGLHSLMAAAWGLIVWWPFVIFSLIYLVWRERGFWAGFAMAAGAHFLHNLYPAIELVILQAKH